LQNHAPDNATMTRLVPHQWGPPQAFVRATAMLAWGAVRRGKSMSSPIWCVDCSL